MNQSDEPATHWLTVAEAAPRLGLTVDGLRSRIKRGLATTRKGNDGRLFVNVAMNGASQGDEPGHDPGHEPAVARSDGHDADRDLLHDLLEARDRAARAEAALVEVRAALQREHAAREREEARADKLAAELAEARKPWVVRVVEALRQR
jgi:hypothetical protein